MHNCQMLRFLVPASEEYLILRFGGKKTSDIEYGIQMFLKHFQNGQFSEQSIRDMQEQHNLQTLLAVVKGHFEREYGFFDARIELTNHYQQSIGSYIWLGDNAQEKPFIHIDELFESALLSFLLVIFKWSKDFNDQDNYGKCFIHTLYLLNDVSIMGELPGADFADALFGEIHGDLQLMNLATDCYWAIAAFSIAHEMAHGYLYQEKGGRNRSVPYSERETIQEEFRADRIAYDIVLKMIMEGRNQERKSRLLEEYTYLAPMMYMDYFDLLYYTNRVLYNGRIRTNTHPHPKKRKEHLFSIPEQDIYELDTVDGNHLYGGFLDAYDAYRSEVLLKKVRGKLDKIIWPEQLKKVRDGQDGQG